MSTYRRFGSGDAKNREYGKYEFLIPLVRCGDDAACGTGAEFFYCSMECVRECVCV